MLSMTNGIQRAPAVKQSNYQSVHFFLLLVSLGWNTFAFVQSNMHFEYAPLLRLIKSLNLYTKNTKPAASTFLLRSYNQYLLLVNFDNFYRGCVRHDVFVLYLGSTSLTANCDFLNWTSWGYKFKFFFWLKQFLFDKPKYLKTLISCLRTTSRASSLFCFFFTPEYHFYAGTLPTSGYIKTGGFVNYTLNPWLLNYPLFGNTADTRIQIAFAAYCVSSANAEKQTVSTLLKNTTFRLKRLHFYKKFNVMQ